MESEEEVAVAASGAACSSARFGWKVPVVAFGGGHDRRVADGTLVKVSDTQYAVYMAGGQFDLPTLDRNIRRHYWVLKKTSNTTETS